MEFQQQSCVTLTLHPRWSLGLNSTHTSSLPMAPYIAVLHYILLRGAAAVPICLLRASMPRDTVDTCSRDTACSLHIQAAPSTTITCPAQPHTASCDSLVLAQRQQTCADLSC